MLTYVVKWSLLNKNIKKTELALTWIISVFRCSIKMWTLPVLEIIFF